jgi:hypothetical protein
MAIPSPSTKGLKNIILFNHFFRRPTLDDTWSQTTEIDVTKTEYFEIGQNMGMRVGYRTNERVAWNAV